MPRAHMSCELIKGRTSAPFINPAQFEIWVMKKKCSFVEEKTTYYVEQNIFPNEKEDDKA